MSRCQRQQRQDELLERMTRHSLLSGSQYPTDEPGGQPLSVPGQGAPSQRACMIVESLTEYPQFRETLARWHYDEWGSLYPDQTLRDFCEDLRAPKRGELLPITSILVEGGEVWGSASVIPHDMATHQDLTPWLANVYIHPEKRGLGLGRKLVRETMQRCSEKGLTELFLFTPDHEHFYQTLGWQSLSRESYEGEMVSLMTVRF